MPDQDFRFRHRLRVRWAEVDLQRIVFNAHYLLYFDTAMADHWRALAIPLPHALEGFQADLFLRKASVEYRASAGYDDLLDIGLRCARIGNSSIVFQAAVFRGDRCLVDGELVYVLADLHSRRPVPVPPALRAVFEAYDRGEPMVSVRVGRWADLMPEAQPLRHEVFVKEQGIPAELEWDPADAEAVHAVAHNRLGQPLATGRLLQAGPGIGKIGRMAVRAPLRGAQVGRAVLDALLQQARQRGDTQVLLHAQQSALGFYRRAGFRARGPVFEEAGIPHQEMVIDC